MMTGYEEMTSQVRSWVRVAMEVCDIVNNRSFFWLELALFEEPLDTNVVVSRENKNRDTAAYGVENSGDFCPFLPGKRGNAVLYIPEEDKPFGLVTSTVFKSRSRRSLL